MPQRDETIRRGRYRERLTFQSKTVVQDTTGGSTEEWTDEFTVWGEVQLDKSDLLHISDKRFAESLATFRIPYQPTHFIQAKKHRVVWVSDPQANPRIPTEDDPDAGLSIWDIYPPLADRRRRELTIKARQYDGGK